MLRIKDCVLPFSPPENTFSDDTIKGSVFLLCHPERERETTPRLTARYIPLLSSP